MEDLGGAASGSRIRPATASDRPARMASAILYVRRAAEIADDAMRAMMAATRPGAFEGDIATEGQSVILRAGGDVAPSGPTIGSGERAFSGRASTGARHLAPVDQLTIEFAAPYRRYCACLMRTLVVGGATERHGGAWHGAVPSRDGFEVLV
jgi:Xaa-Pro aminopeptidase